jgi:hypothetical protein
MSPPYGLDTVISACTDFVGMDRGEMWILGVSEFGHASQACAESDV